MAETASGPVSYIGLAVDAGSRDDPADGYGLAHFLEHTIFKGTRRRRAWHITNRMERIGGELNAYTTKELTMIYTVAPSGHTERAIELLADLVKCATFPAQECEREKDIVIEEIHSYSDSPSDAVFDEFDEFFYAGSGMAHNILGSEATVRGLDGAKARAFLDHCYTPGRITIYCVDSEPQKGLRLIERYFGDMDHPDAARTREVPPVNAPFEKVIDKGHTQANTILGCRIPGRISELRPAFSLFNNILGGPALNSRLAYNLRERHGLAYSVESNVMMFSDCGSFIVYLGHDPSTWKRCRKLIGDEIDSLAQSPMSPRAFERVRDQYCGQLAVLADNRESNAMALGRSLLFYDEVHTLSDTIEQIRRVTPEQLLMASRIVGESQMSILSIY